MGNIQINEKFLLSSVIQVHQQEDVSQRQWIHDSKPPHLYANSLGEVWIDIQQGILDYGQLLDDYIEMRNVDFHVPQVTLPDIIIDRWADQSNIIEMHKVFLTEETNRFGHSYHSRMAGPFAGDPIEAVVAVLTAKQSSRQAVINISNDGNGNVPCVNIIHFMIRNRVLSVSYYARGQDIFNKFYADALCVFDIAKQVAEHLNIEPISIHGNIGSAHVYLADVPKAQSMIISAFKDCMR